MGFVSGLATGFPRRGFLDDGLGGGGRIGGGRQGRIGGVFADEFAELTHFLAESVQFPAQLVDECVAFPTSLALRVLHVLKLRQTTPRGQYEAETR
jgi:hypothetical protein